MKKTILLLTLLSILLNIGLVYMFVFRGQTNPSNDNRVEIVMNQANTDFALAEMRGFLESIQAINEGILKNDAQKIIESGKISGGTVVDHAPPGMMKTLPIGFKKLGFATHDLFDEISDTAKESFDPKRTHEQLNVLLNNCVTCHRAYKIKTVRQTKIIN